MSNYRFWCYLLINLTTFIYFVSSLSAEYNLFNNLTKNYTKNVRPVKNWNDTLDIFVNVNLKKIANVAEYHQSILIYVQLEMIWNDLYLTWEPSINGNIQSIMLPADQIWIPDLHLFNGAAENDRIYPSFVQVYFNGTVKAYPINQLYAHCAFDFDDFPFDTQSCDFMVGNMVEKSKVKIWLSSSVNKEYLIPNFEWDFIKLKDRPEFELKVPGTMDHNDWFSNDWSVTMFTLKIKRNSKFYRNLFIWPIIFILVVGSCVFILPCSCVERASMGVLLLLAEVIMSLMLDSYTPKNSVSFTVIDQLIAFSMFMVTWSTFVSTIIISFDKDTLVYRKVPSWLKNLLLNYLGKLTFKYGTLDRILNTDPLNQDDDIDVMDGNQLLQNYQTETPQSSNNQIESHKAKTLLVLINNHLAMFRTRIKEKEAREQNKRDWMIIACVIDRFCLIIYFTISLIGLFIIFI